MRPSTMGVDRDDAVDAWRNLCLHMRKLQGANVMPRSLACLKKNQDMSVV